MTTWPSSSGALEPCVAARWACSRALRSMRRTHSSNANGATPQQRACASSTRASARAASPPRQPSPWWMLSQARSALPSGRSARKLRHGI
eukprot:1892457-Prymnesium_polylepis.1